MTDTKKPNETPAVVPATPAPAPVVAEQTEADKIWDEIKDRKIEMFALPKQTVSMHCTPFPVEPTKLYVTTRSTAVLPSLEASCGEDFVCELADRFVIIKRATPKVVLPPKK